MQVVMYPHRVSAQQQQNMAHALLSHSRKKTKNIGFGEKTFDIIRHQFPTPVPSHQCKWSRPVSEMCIAALFLGIWLGTQVLTTSKAGSSSTCISMGISFSSSPSAHAPWGTWRGGGTGDGAGTWAGRPA